VSLPSSAQAAAHLGSLKTPISNQWYTAIQGGVHATLTDLEPSSTRRHLGLQPGTSALNLFI
jgi:hypothetical protein